MNLRRKIPRVGQYTVMPILFFAGALSCAPANAALEDVPAKPKDGDTFTPYAEYDVYYDANLLRQPESVVRSGAAVSDRWTRAVGGLLVDKEIGQQRITADLSANHSEYSHFTQYDNDGKNLLANWNWGLGNHLSGNIGSTYSQGLTPFEDFDILQRSIKTEQRNYFDMGWLIHPSWRLNAGYSQYDLKYDLESEAPSERTLDTATVGFDYLAASGNKVGIVFNHINGDFQFAPENSYTQNEVKGKVDWQITGKTYIQFLGGWAKREYASNPESNSSLPSLRVTGYWMATGKTGILLSAWRELGATDYLAANYARNQGVSLGANWAATDKITVDGLLMSERLSYNDVVELEGAAPLNRVDDYRKASLGITYKPTLHVKIRALAYRQDLDSTIATSSYRTNGLQLTGRYEF